MVVLVLVCVAGWLLLSEVLAVLPTAPAASLSFVHDDPIYLFRTPAATRLLGVCLLLSAVGVREKGRSTIRK